MAIRIGRLYAETYYEDMEIGMWFKIPRVNYVTGNENALNDQIDDLNIKLEKDQTDPKNQAWKACLAMLHDKYYNELQPYWQNAFSSKSYLLIFNVTEKAPSNIKYEPFAGNFADGFVAYKLIQKTPYTIWEVATKYSSDNLAHRFRRADYQNEVKKYLDTFGTVTPPPVTPPDDEPDDEPDGGGTVPSGGLTMHLVCPHCGKKIF